MISLQNQIYLSKKLFRTIYVSESIYILGGKDSDFKGGPLLNIIQFLKIGLPEAMLYEAARLMGLNKKHVILLIGKASGSTSLKSVCRLSPNQSERMLMIIEVLAQAEEYYGNNAAALKCLIIYLRTNVIS